jgi:hypothetical protein
MHTSGKWLVRGGSFLILFGFFMPFMLVSCSLAPTASQPISLSQIASMIQQPLLYLVPLGALAAIGFAFLPAKQTRHQTQFLIAQIIGLGLGVLSLAIALISLSSQLQQPGISIQPALGFYVLFGGYAAATAGIVMQFQENARMGIPFSFREAGFGPPMLEVQPAKYPSTSGARLEVVQGRTTDSVIPVYDGFMIGRGSRASLSLPDRSVSVQHARLRFAQGIWFLQDQSANGTFVNGEQITATRLSPGDQISIGDTTFVFRI